MSGIRRVRRQNNSFFSHNNNKGVLREAGSIHLSMLLHFAVICIYAQESILKQFRFHTVNFLMSAPRSQFNILNPSGAMFYPETIF